MEQRKISRAVISRLPRYYRYLGDLLEAGVERISSNDLSKKMQVTASQIRQDLSCFGEVGQQGYGYNVDSLRLEGSRILGMDRNHIAIADNGSVIELTVKTLKIGGSVPAGEVYVDGSGVGDEGAVVMRARKRLAEDGMVVVVMPISSHDGALLSPPDIVTRGFIYVKESGDLMKELQNVALEAAESVTRKRSRDDGELKGAVKSAVSSYLFKTTKRSPMVIPVVTRL